MARRPVLNIHQRVIPASPVLVGALLETLGSDDDRIWTTRIVPPIRLSAGLTVGSAGGHGPIRYRVVDHRPGVRVRFEFAPGLPLIGWHEVEVGGVGQARPALVPPPEYAGGPRALIRHTLSARLSASGRLLWPTFIRPLHDAAIEDMFTNLELACGGTAHPQQPIPTWVRRLGTRLTARAERRGRPLP